MFSSLKNLLDSMSDVIKIYVLALSTVMTEANLKRPTVIGTNKTNNLILNLTPENVTQHSRIVTTTRKGSSTPTKMSKIIGRQTIEM